MKRVAAYCRVSTEQDDQLNSLENQKQYFEQHIRNNLDWEFCGLYVDEGISGTSVEKREGFKQMIADAKARKFDLVLTKSISRFARNTLDSILYTRELKALGIGVYFMSDNINTLDPNAELHLTILSAIAQQESNESSKRVKWGQKRRMEQGFVFGVRPFGYNLINGKLTINKEESKIVKLIFNLYLSGKGVQLVSKELENRGIPAPNGTERWKNITILRILKNEKYIGMLKQRKRITVDFLSHKRKTNEGEEEFVIVENSHEPIIEKEIFDMVQAELARRKTAAFEKSRYSNRYPWSGKVKCALCNASFKRRINNVKSSNPQIIWLCSEADKYGREKINPQGKKVGCNCKAVPEWVLRENFLAVLNGVIENKDLVVQELKDHVRQAIAASPNKGDEINEVRAGLEAIAGKKSGLIDMRLDKLITVAEYQKSRERYDKQEAALLKRLADLGSENKAAEDLKLKLDNIDRAIENLVRLIEFSDEICSGVLHKVVVEDREKMSFYLKTDENKDPAFFKIPLLIRQD
jgi:DNA invertase Pin-like site-specific DNA recombinase